MLQCGDEGEPDRLALDHDVGGVGNWLDPGDLRQRAQVLEDRLARRPEVHRARAALLAAEHVEADVRGDAVEPRAQRRSALEALEAAPGADERLLDRVLGLERRGEHAVAVGLELGAVLLQLLLETGLSPEGRPFHEGESYAVGRR